MRALCTVRGPLAGGAAAPAAGGSLPPGARLLSLRAPGLAQPLHFVVEAKSRVKELLAQAHTHFQLRGMSDSRLFGLAILTNGEYLFVDLDSKLSKYAPKSWRSSHTHGLDANGRPLLELHLTVQFYVDSPLLLPDDVTRHLYYLQLRANMLVRDSLPAEVFLLLTGLALQAEYGDADHYADRDYFNTKEFAPPSLTGDWVSAAMRACHRDNRGLSAADAETKFIREVCLLPDSVNSHKFRMKQTKTEPDAGTVWLLVTAKGIHVLPDNGSASNYIWSSIGKLSFDRKKFEIRTENEKMTLYSSSDDKSKYLFALCRDTHQFSMKIAPELSEALKKEEEERKRCYGYSKNLDFQNNKNKNEQRVSVISSASSTTTSGIVSDRVQSEDELEIMIDSPPALSTESLAFAHLLDCSNGYYLGEHSQDKARLCKTASLQYPRTKSNHSSSSDEIKKDVAQSLTKNKHSSTLHSDEVTPGPETTSLEQQSDSPVSNKLKCNGSQCSSSCSTVVMARTELSLRRSSNASSLELGYSHTAQNSMLSDNSATGIDMDYIQDTASALYDGFGQPVTVAASSETSGVYTMGSSEATARHSKTDTVSEASRTECGSSHYGSFQMSNEDDLTRFHSVSSIIDSVIKEHKNLVEENLIFRLQSECGIASADCVDGIKMYLCDEEESKEFRHRAGSNASAASFHGDGSDPTDNKHTLLSASELSDLIVGRGVYPKRQSVSDTLDSVSDYVRLPLSLTGESYLQGHEDTAPSDDNYLGMEDPFFERPPTPPARIDSRKLHNLSLPNILDLDDIQNSVVTFPSKPPPPYEFNHKTVSQENSTWNNSETESSIKNPPPYPAKMNLDQLKYPTGKEEVTARLVTSKPMITILKAEAGEVYAPIEKTFASPMMIEHRFQKSKQSHTTSRRVERSKLAQEICHQKHDPSVLSVDSSVLVAMMKLPPPPPPRSSRLPPPPPPPPHLQQFHQQLYSDVDYVIYPMQDPAISQQNYLDSKLAQNANWHSDIQKNGLQYRSTPFLSASMPGTSIYGSTQNLSDSYVQLPGTRASLYSMTSQSSTASGPTCHLDRPPLPVRANMSMFTRTKSDDNILNSVDAPSARYRRLPPPPPPYEHKKKLPSHLREVQIKKSMSPQRICSADTEDCKKECAIDIKTLREKSKNLDLPLISALCNDRSLLKQTKAFVAPKSRQIDSDAEFSKKQGVSSVLVATDSAHFRCKPDMAVKSPLQTTQGKKLLVRNPNDKLPDIPTAESHTPRAMSNTYVALPGAPTSRHLQPRV